MLFNKFVILNCCCFLSNHHAIDHKEKDAINFTVNWDHCKEQGWSLSPADILVGINPQFRVYSELGEYR